MTRATAEYVMVKLANMVGAGFHPDTPFANYVTLDGTPAYSPQAADDWDAILANCMAVLGEDGYGIAGECVRKAVGEMRAALIELDAMPTR